MVNDYPIRYAKKIYQIARADLRPGLRGATVRVEEREDRSVWVRFRDPYLTVKGCEPLARPQPQPAREPVRKIPRASARPPSRRWLEGFSLNNSLPRWKILKHEAGRCRPAGGGPLRALWALTPVALRAPSVSAPPQPEFSTLP